MLLLTPDWPAPATVKAVSSTREGGCSSGQYHSLNLGLHVGDELQAVLSNRQRFRQAAAMPAEPCYLEQVHGTDVVTLPAACTTVPVADAAYTAVPQQVCTVMTADCLPLLVCNKAGTEVAAIHAGWRGLVSGIIENSIAAFSAPRAELLVWLGPAIGPLHFEVGKDVFTAFTNADPKAVAAFTVRSDSKYLACLYTLARLRLQQLGVSAIYGGNDCTYSASERFFSYRRDGQTGRMASAIWLTK